MSNASQLKNDSSKPHAAYIKNQEYKAAGELIKHQGSKFQQHCLTNAFFQSAYNRVADMFTWEDFDRCKKLIMVGCGPLPMTLMHVAAKYPSIPLEGLDSDLHAIEVARTVARAATMPNIHLIHSNGVSYSYHDANIVYVANLVSPKVDVLMRIANTASIGTLVILRDPTEDGLHLADSGLQSLNSKFHIEAEGDKSEVFHSRHIFLRVIDHQ